MVNFYRKRGLVCAARLILAAVVALIVLSAASSAGMRESKPKEITTEQREKAYVILRQALAIVERDEHDRIKGMPIGSIAVVLARIDMDEALYLIDKMPTDPLVRLQTLSGILRQAATTGKERGNKHVRERVIAVIDNVIATTDRLTSRLKDETDAEARGWGGLGFLGISGSLARAIGIIAEKDSDLALAITNRIKDDEMSKTMRWLGLVHIADAIAEKDTDEALAVASGNEDEKMKSLALIYIASQTAENNHERAQAILDEALEIIVELSPQITGFLSLFDDVLRPRGKPPVFGAIAKVSPDAAESLVTSIRRGMRTRGVLADRERETTGKLVQIVAEVAKANPSKALEIAHGETYAPSKAQMLSKIGVVIAEKDPDKALCIADEIEKIRYVEARVKAQRAEVIAKAAAEVSKKDKKRGLMLLEQALTAAGEEGQILKTIAATAAQIEVDKALQIAGKIDEASTKTWALHDIATSVAQTSPDKALEIADKIQENFMKGWTLHSIAALVSKKNPDKALIIAEKIKEDAMKVRALCSIAVAILGIEQEVMVR